MRLWVARELGDKNDRKMGNIMAIYDESIPQAVPEFMPDGLADGRLEAAKPFQIFLCRFLEDGPVAEANGLYIQGEPGIGKTTSQKLLYIRYPGQVFEAPSFAERSEMERCSR